MKIKKISLLLVTVILTFGLSGCMSGGGAKMPEGDVVVAKQQVQGVLDFVLQSADYGADQSIIASMVLPKDSAYDLVFTREQYKNGELVETKALTTYTTEVIEKDDMIHMIVNAGMASEEGNIKTIYSVAEVDREKTTDKKQPIFKVAKINEPALSYDLKTDIAQIGTDFDTEIALTGYVKFKAEDTEKTAINLETYKDEVSKYEEVNIVKVKVIKK